MRKITDWKVLEQVCSMGSNGWSVISATFISAKVDGSERQITIDWTNSKLIVSIDLNDRYAENAQTFDLPNTDLLTFLSENME